MGLARTLDHARIHFDGLEFLGGLRKAKTGTVLVDPWRAENRASAIRAGTIEDQEVDLVLDGPANHKLMPDVEGLVSGMSAAMQHQLYTVIDRRRAAWADCPRRSGRSGRAGRRSVRRSRRRCARPASKCRTPLARTVVNPTNVHQLRSSSRSAVTDNRSICALVRYGSAPGWSSHVRTSTRARWRDWSGQDRTPMRRMTGRNEHGDAS